MADILKTGISALTAFQRQLSTTGHNIANVNTEGYSRQRVELSALEPQRSGLGYIGSGVEVSAVRRNYDGFLATQVRSYTASQQEYAVYYDRANQINNMLGDEASGINQMMQEFYASIQDVSADPTSVPARTVMLSRANELVDRFHSLDNWLGSLHSQVNKDFSSYVSEINNLGSSIADINQRIQAMSTDPSSPPNDLLDQRDKLIDDLSKYVNVTTVAQDDGAVNIFVGSGQALVVGATSNTMTVQNDPAAADRKDLAISVIGGGSVVITDQISGGKLGGLLRFRKEVLDPAQDSLGLIAVGLAQTFNDQHVLGNDLDGNTGGAFFNVGTPDLSADSTNTGAATVTAAFSAVGDLTGHEYQLQYDGTDWLISDLSTGAPATVLGPSGTFVHDGVQLTISAGAAAGDTYLLRPTHSGATNIDSLISDPRQVAAAQSTAVGDNRNALALADLQNSQVLFGNTTSISDTYGSLVADIGTQTHQASANADSQQQLLTQAKTTQSAVSGVNLDEEAADLVRFQQAYSAAAQVIATANTLFDTLLGAVRG